MQQLLRAALVVVDLDDDVVNLHLLCSVIRISSIINIISIISIMLC